MQLVELCLNNPNEDKKIREFNKSAVRFLIKELKASPKLLKELERAISEKCSDSKCITIPAKSESRLLVAHRRCRPQVIYCRLWRWPDLQSHHQIKSICPTNRSADGGSGAICINPYHYERNTPKQIDPVLVPCSKIPPDLSSSVEDSGPREERTKSWPAKVSFIQHLQPYLYKQNQPEQAGQSSGMRTTNSAPRRIATGHTMISTDELHVDQIAQLYNGTYTQASDQHLGNSISEINSHIQNDQENSSPGTSQGTGFLCNRLTSIDVTKHDGASEKGDNNGFKPGTHEQTSAIKMQSTLMSPSNSNRLEESKSGSLELMENMFPVIEPLMEDEMMQEQNQTNEQQLMNNSSHAPTDTSEAAGTDLNELGRCSPRTYSSNSGLEYQVQFKLDSDKQDGIEASYQNISSNSIKPHVSSAQPQQSFTASSPTQYLSDSATKSVHQEYQHQIAPQQQFYQPQTPQAQQLPPQQPQQYQQSPFQPIANPQQQQYLQTQANLHTAPYQFQARDQSGRSQGRHYQKQQQPSHMSLLQQSQYQANMSQGGIGPLTSQPKPLTTRADVNRPFRFRAKGFAGRIDQEQTNVCRDPRYNGYAGNPYPCGSQRMSTQVAFSQPGPTQRPDMAISTMANSNLSSQLMCPTSNTSFGSTSTVTAQQASHAQVPNADYPTIFSPQQQYSAQEQTMQLSYPTDSTMSVAEQPSSFECYTGTVTNQGQNAGVDHQMDQTSGIDVQEIPFIDDKYWCSITYHEYDQRIGEKYHSCSPIVSVDGFTQPMCNDRFCIGGISNVNRNQFTEWVRRRIGRGVKLTYVDGDVYVEGISESSVFVSNPLHDIDSQKGAPDDLVVKLSTGCSARVFSTHEFGKLLHAAVSEGFEAVYKLTSKCVIKVSFVKGWGKNYKRQSIYNTPCWVEVQLNGPLQWIDKVLRQMRPPMGCCSTS
uniref:Mothers against decapentaplegic homolog n=1 Tax=Aceria tosichella TaxID=561515 RepID=A0A6G1SFV3_9ACAR